MAKRQKYATALTKEDLIRGGITLVTEDGLVFKDEQQVMPSITNNGYWMIYIYELDENGDRIKIPVTRKVKGSNKVIESYTYKIRTLGLHRVMWAWFNNIVPSGHVVDHISNKHLNLEDYRLENLQLLTPAENLAKEREVSNKQIKCKLDRPLSWYTDRLNKYIATYELAKENHDAEEVHRLRNNISNMKARIRYYLANKTEADEIAEEIEAYTELQKSYHDRATEIKSFKARIAESRRLYKKALACYGPADWVTLDFKSKWKQEVFEFNKWLEKNPKVVISKK